jgi:hypothetical protein
VTRAGEYSFTGHDLQTFHQSPLQIFDASAESSLSTAEGLSTGFRFWTCD